MATRVPVRDSLTIRRNGMKHCKALWNSLDDIIGREELTVLPVHVSAVYFERELS
jgi:hypothetical protein